MRSSLGFTLKTDGSKGSLHFKITERVNYSSLRARWRITKNKKKKKKNRGTHLLGRKTAQSSSCCTRSSVFRNRIKFTKECSTLTIFNSACSTSRCIRRVRRRADVGNCVSPPSWRSVGSFESGMGAEYQSVMSIGPNKVMNGNCKPRRPRTVLPSSLFIPAHAIRPSTDFEHASLSETAHRLASIASGFPYRSPSILNRLIGFSRGT